MESTLVAFFVLAVVGAIGYILYLRHETALLKKSLDASNAFLADRKARVEKLEENRLKEEKEKRDEATIKTPTATVTDGLNKLLEATRPRHPGS